MLLKPRHLPWQGRPLSTVITATSSSYFRSIKLCMASYRVMLLQHAAWNTTND